MTELYHLRRSEAAISNLSELQDVIRGQKYMTLAMSRGNQPYLVTLNYAYDAAANCLFFHCAGEGKKIDYLQANPLVWGQILEDHGIIPGECDHAFRCVEFSGQVDFLETEEDKHRALTLLVDQLEPDPAPVKERMLNQNRVSGVTIGRVTIQSMTGKQRKSKA